MSYLTFSMIIMTVVTVNIVGFVVLGAIIAFPKGFLTYFTVGRMTVW